MSFRRSSSSQSDATSGPSSLLPSDSLSQALNSRPTPSEAETSSSRHVVKRRKLRATSTWDHFREAEGDEPRTRDGNTLHYCKRCGNPTWSTHVTGNARFHLRSEHHIVVQEDSKPQKKRQPAIENAFARTAVKQMQQVKEKEINTLRNAINFDGFREAQMLLAARRRVPLNFVTWPEYQALLMAINPAVEGFLTDSGDTVAADLDRAYSAHQESIKERLQLARSPIHFSMDVWSSPHRKVFIAVHAQWVDENYILRKALLGLPNLRHSHAGAAMAPHLMNVFRKYNLARRVGYFTGDNDSKNDTCLRQLAEDLSREYDVSFDPVFYRTRCVGHIINLSLQAFLFATSKSALQATIEQAQDEANETTVVESLQEQIRSSASQRGQDRGKGRKARNDATGWRSIGAMGKLHNIAVFIRSSDIHND